MEAAIVIAGAGPVGLMLAHECALADLDVLVLERSPEPRTDAPGMAINGTVVELLNQRGLMDSLRDDGLEWPAAHFAHLPLDPARLPGRHAYNFVVPQTVLERRLEEHAVKAGVRIMRGHEVVTVDQDGSGVTVRIRSGGTEHAIRCAYLVGCDGADSRVRESAGILFPGEDAPFYGITGDLAATDELFGHLGAHQYDAGLFTVAPSGPGIVRVSTGEFGRETADPDAAPTVEELGAHIKALTGLEPELTGVRWLARWHDRTRQAERYRDGRILLAGDAAHVHFPLGGQALSTGIEDAVNLGWKLASHLAGHLPASLLDTYHAERHPVGERACRTTRAQSALMHPMRRIEPLRAVFQDLIGLAEVNAHLVRMAGGFDVRYDLDIRAGEADGHPLVGTRPANLPLETEAGSTTIAELLRQGRGVILDLSGGALGPGDVSGWADRVDVVLAEPSAELSATAVLLRPDGRIAWASADTDDEGLRTALATWFGPASHQASPAKEEK